jgi:two-component system OmpR family sensor kinase
VPTAVLPVRVRRRAAERLRRLRPASLRGRLAVLFALGSGSLLVASAGFLYASLDRQLAAAVDAGLRSRADDIEADVASGSLQVRQEEAFAQLVGLDGTVLSSSRTIAAGRRVLTDEELAAARRGTTFFERPVPGLARHARLLAEPVEAGGGNVVLVVGAGLDAIERARRRLALVLLVASPVLVGALAGGGWVLTGAALRPVRRMAEEADAISLAEPGRRLPQPPGEDEIAELGRTLNAMLARIEASFARERAFVDDASHELRTPLSILRAELELALGSARDPSETEAALRSALEEVDRLSRLADDLLVLARADAGQLPIEPADVDLAELAARVVRRLGSRHPVVTVSGGPVRARVDPRRVEQVVTNLVDNARRHARERVVVTVGRDAGEAATITVADDGPGFAAEVLPVAFGRFTRAGASRGRAREGGGAGLGLAIVAALVAAHGGSVAAANGGPLGGAVVRVRLPSGGPARRAG